MSVYRLTREDFDSIERREMSPIERLTGMQVTVIDDIDPDVVYIIDRAALKGWIERDLFPADDIGIATAWKVRIG